MGVSKNAHIRYRILDRCLRSNNYYSVEQLLLECNNVLAELGTCVEKRQIYYDLNFFQNSEGFSAPLLKIRNAHTIYYTYEDKNFSIYNQILKENEIVKIREALLNLSGSKGLPQYFLVEEIISGLNAAFLLPENVEKIIEFDSNEFLKGVNFIGCLYESIFYKNVLNVKYLPFLSESHLELTFHPYFIKQYHNRWFVFGLSKVKNFEEYNQKIVNLALDRILDLSVNHFEPFCPNNLNFNEYFDDVVGVTVYDHVNIEKVKLKVLNSRYPYIETKPIHGSQKRLDRESNENFTVISLDIKINPEFESLLLYYGPDIEVLEPENLRNRISDIINEMFVIYK